MIVFLVLSLVGLKAYQQTQTLGTAPTTAGEQSSSAAALSASGVAPVNGMPASPSPNVTQTTVSTDSSSDDDDGDDGAMTATVAMTSVSEQPEPQIMGGQALYDTNETQSTSGQDNPTSMAYRVQGYPKNNKSNYMDKIWADACDTNYISSQPSIQNQFHAPGVQRQDWNPQLNNQPWSRNNSFKTRNDPTSDFDTDDDGIPSITNTTEDDV